MQRTWKDDPRYLDVEGVIYHYPQQYASYIDGFERFLYYRPARGASPAEASTYVGYGALGQPFPDVDNPSHWFVPIRQYHPFDAPISYSDPTGRFYESKYTSRTAFTGRSVRPVSPNDFFRILAAAGIAGDPYESLPDTEVLVAAAYSPLPITRPPTQPLRPMTEVPPGTGYRPTGMRVDVFESAALQERARSDHQHTLRAIHSLVHQRGGRTLYNNNVDMLATVREQRLLIEAKSINDPGVVVDRMRYGIGQLADYSVRYRSDIGDAERVLAFGAIPSGESAWISTILQESHIAFVGLDRAVDRVLPLNERARALPLFEAP
jgi:hypothetical protein